MHPSIGILRGYPAVWHGAAPNLSEASQTVLDYQFSIEPTISLL